MRKVEVDRDEEHDGIIEEVQRRGHQAEGQEGLRGQLLPEAGSIGRLGEVQLADLVVVEGPQHLQQG